MGAIEYDPIVNRISSRLGNFVYSSWKGKNVIKRYSKRSGAFTENQLRVQKTFKETAFIWKSLPVKMKASWKASINGIAMTEMNMFLSKNTKLIAEGKPCLITRGTGVDRLSGLHVTSDTTGSVNISYNTLSASPVISVVLQKITEEECSPLIIENDISATESSAVVSGLESGAEYYLYVVVTDKPFAEAAKMSESDGFRIKIA